MGAWQEWEEPLVIHAARAILKTGYDRVFHEVETEPPVLNFSRLPMDAKKSKVRFVVRNEGKEPLQAIRIHSAALQTHRFRKQVETTDGQPLVVLDSRICFDAISCAAAMTLEQLSSHVQGLKTQFKGCWQAIHRVLEETDTNGCLAPSTTIEEAQFELDETIALVSGFSEDSNFMELLAHLNEVRTLLRRALLGHPPLVAALPPGVQICAPTCAQAEHHPCVYRLIVKHHSLDVESLYLPESLPFPAVVPWLPGMDSDAGFNAVVREKWPCPWYQVYQLPFRGLARLAAWALGIAYNLVYYGLILLFLAPAKILGVFVFNTIERRYILDRPSATHSFHVRFQAPLGMIMTYPTWPSLQLAFRWRDGDWQADEAFFRKEIAIWPKLRVRGHNPESLKTPEIHDRVFCASDALDIVIPSRSLDEWTSGALDDVKGFVQEWNHAVLGWRGKAAKAFVRGLAWRRAPTSEAMEFTGKFWIGIKLKLPPQSFWLVWGTYALVVVAWFWLLKSPEYLASLITGQEELFAALVALYAALATQVFLTLRGAARAITGVRLILPVGLMAIFLWRLILVTAAAKGA